MRSKEIVGLVGEARRRGFRVKETRSGVIVYGDDGVSTASAHWTPSDRRSVKNLRADLRRLGVFDTQRHR